MLVRLFVGGILALAAAPVVAADTKPNIIVFLSDDVGYGEYGFQGNPEIPTPNIDSIAKNGVRFTQAYVAATYCSPSRAGLMTGRYPTRFGHEFNGGGGAGGKVEPDWKLDGVDLMPYLTGKKTEPPHETLYWRFGEQWAIRKGDWKLVASRIDGVKEPKLYNLKDDIGESKDLSSAQPEKVKELRGLWEAWSEEQMEPRWLPAKKKAKKNKK